MMIIHIPIDQYYFQIFLQLEVTKTKISKRVELFFLKEQIRITWIQIHQKIDQLTDKKFINIIERHDGMINTVQVQRFQQTSYFLYLKYSSQLLCLKLSKFNLTINQIFMKFRHRQALKNLFKNPNRPHKPINIDDKLLNLPPLDLSTDIFEDFHQFYLVYEDHHQKNHFSQQNKQNKSERTNNGKNKSYQPLQAKNCPNKCNRLNQLIQRTQITSQSPKRKKHKSLKSKIKGSTVSTKGKGSKQQGKKVIRNSISASLFPIKRKSIPKKNKIR